MFLYYDWFLHLDSVKKYRQELIILKNHALAALLCLLNAAYRLYISRVSCAFILATLPPTLTFHTVHVRTSECTLYHRVVVNWTMWKIRRDNIFIIHKSRNDLRHVRKSGCHISEQHCVCGIMENSKDTVLSNIADLLQKIDCDDLIPRFEGKCIYFDYSNIKIMRFLIFYYQSFLSNNKSEMICEMIWYWSDDLMKKILHSKYIILSLVFSL